MAGKRVAIAGGGLSGLSLAQALLLQGWDVHVYERDAGSDVRGQGYRLTIKPPTFDALREGIPPKVYEFLTATTKRSMGDTGFVFADEQLRPYFRRAFPIDDPSIMAGQIDRKTFRQGLLIGLEGHVHYGKAVASYEETVDGVTLRFQDGDSTTVDLLVGADGVFSAVRQQRLPDARPASCDFHSIFGRTLASSVPAESLVSGIADMNGLMCVRPDSVGFFTTRMQFAEDPVDVARRLGVSVGPCSEQGYYMWAVGIPAPRDPDRQRTAQELHALSLQLLSHHHPDVLQLVEAAIVEDTVVVPIRYTPPTPAWQASRVTLIGDAIHTMPPFGANGANTAMRDSMLLASCLKQHRDDPSVSIESCVARYEQEMRVYSQEMVQDGLNFLTNLHPKSALRSNLVMLVLHLLRYRFIVLIFLIVLVGFLVSLVL